MEHCPICRARWGEGTVCRRCGSDLVSALAVRGQAARLERAVLGQLRLGRPARAARLAQRALLLCHTPMAKALWGFVAQYGVAPEEATSAGEARPADAAQGNLVYCPHDRHYPAP